LGNDRNWSTTPGFRNTGLFRIHSGSPCNYKYNFGDSDPVAADEFVPNLMLLGRLFPEHESVYAYVARQLVDGKAYGDYGDASAVAGRGPDCAHEDCALNLLGYSSKGSVKDLEKLPKEALFSFRDLGWEGRKAVGFIRSSWTERNATWLAFMV
jgi:hypothetical protein